MIYILDNGEVYSNHTLYFVDAPDDFGAWFNNVYRPWIDGTEYRPLTIVATAPAVERRERVAYNPRPADNLDLPIEEFPMHEFSTMLVVDFLAKIVVQERDGKPRPRYRLEIENVRPAGENLDPRPEAALLLANIKVALPALEALRDRCDSEIEDGLYRFYHQSFKVYGLLQKRACETIAKLRALAPEPGKPLDKYFEEIFGQGTGQKWEKFHNAEWTKHTRPIVEAFFHARYFLGMAIEYGRELEQPPNLLPSGWAALLALYGLR
jgi:hypothetical protein